MMRRRFVLVGLVFLAFLNAPLYSADQDRCISFLSSLSSYEKLGFKDVQELRHLLEEQVDSWVQDPFFFATTIERQNQVWSSLVSSFPPVETIRKRLFESRSSNTALDPLLIQKTLQDAEKILIEKPSAISHRNQKLVAAIEALRMIERYLRPIDEESSLLKKEKKDQKQDQKQDPEKDKKQSSSQPPTYPHLAPNYQAHNKDTDKGEESGSESQSRVSIATANIPNRKFFRGLVYSSIDARNNRWFTLEMTEPFAGLTTSRHSPHWLIARPLDKKNEVLPLFIPEGFVPITFSNADGEIGLSARTPNYFFKTHLDELKIELVPQGLMSRPLSVTEFEAYTEPSDIDLSEWPEHLQNAVHELQDLQSKNKFDGPHGNLKLAQTLASYISNHFKYRVDQSKDTDLLKLCAQGSFQCDTSATVAVSILRKEFKIPCRIVGGIKGIGEDADPSLSHAIIPGREHAWIEIYDQLPSGEYGWFPVDATPHTKDKESEDKGSPDQFSEFQEDSENQQESASESVEKKQARDASSDGQKSIRELVQDFEILQEASQKALAQKEKTIQNAEAQQSYEDSKSKESEDMSQPKLKTDELLKQLEKAKPLIARTLKRFVRLSLSLHLSSSEKREKLARLRRVFGEDEEGLFPEFKPYKTILIEALEIFHEDRPPFDEWFQRLLVDHEKYGINDFHDELLMMERQLIFTRRFMDQDEVEGAQSFLATLQALRREFLSIRHPESKAIRIAKDLFDNLPGRNTRKILRDRFSLQDSIADDTASLQFAENIVAGKLNEERLQSILGPHTDFLVKPIRIPARGEIKTWLESQRKQRGRSDFMLTNDPRKWRRFIRLHPELSDADALAQRQMGVILQRKRVPIVEGSSDSEPRKKTIVAIDLSASMANDPAYFQAQYIAALVDKALSDVGPNGEIRHSVYLMGFDTQIRFEREINSVAEALDFLKQVQDLSKAAGGGTDGQMVMIRAAEIIEKANSSGDQALARATVVIMTDGGFSMDVKTVKKKYGEVGRDTSILLALVAINGTNSDFMDLVDKNAIGTDKSMYIEWASEAITDSLQKAKAKPEPLSDFWTKNSWSDLPNNIRQAIFQSQSAIDRYRRRPLADEFYFPITQGFENAALNPQEQPLKRPERRPQNNHGKLNSFRRLLNLLGDQLSPPERGLLLEGIFKEWSKHIPQPVKEFDQFELVHLKYILGWIQSGLAGSLSLDSPEASSEKKENKKSK